MTTPKTEATVYVVDDDEAVRESVIVLLDSFGLPAVGCATGQALIEAISPDDRGCVLLDIRLPDMDGLAVQQELKLRRIRLPIIVITGFADVALAVRAMKAGAHDFIEKPFTDEGLLASVRDALAADEQAADAGASAAQVAARLAQLTPRERAVLDELVLGQQNKQIAYTLGISPRTVEIHRGHVMEKLQARSISQLIRMVLSVDTGGTARRNPT